MIKHYTIPSEPIEKRIFLIRSHKVMMDFHLAELYQIDVKVLKRAVRRNIERFPEDFMFVLSKKEYQSLRSQIGTIKRGEHAKYLPYAFTEQGVAMLSGILNSKQAIHVNIAIMCAFVKLRELISTHKALAKKLEELEQKVERHDEEIHNIFEAIRQLMEPPEQPKKQLGFRVEEKKLRYGLKVK